MQLDELRELLRGYQPPDPAEAAFVARMVELSRAGGAWQRSHFSPGHFTASAFVLSPDHRELVLIHHKKLGIWVQPGGHLEASDADVQAAARREVLEEVGLADLEPFAPGSSPLFDVDIHVIPARKNEPEHFHHDLRFMIEADPGEPLVISNESKDLAWVDVAHVTALNPEESMARMVRKTLPR